MKSQRISYDEAKRYLGFRFEAEFQIWCEDNGLTIHTNGSKQFFVRGKFLAIADAELICELRAHHDDVWIHYYENYELVRPFLKTKTKEELALDKSRYVPESELALDFYKTYVDVA